MIIASLSVYCLLTMPSLKGDPVLKWINKVCLTFFTIEFILRVIVCPRKVQFIKDYKNWIDFLSIIPSYLTIAFPTNKWMYNLVIIRLLRVFKFFKLSYGLQVLLHTLKASSYELTLLLLILLIPLVVFSSLVYAFEYTGTSGNTDFDSIPRTFWWTIVTMTTVGYGDMAPKTWIGQVIGSLCAIISVLIIALPISVIGNNFNLYYAHVRARLKLPKKNRQLLQGRLRGLLKQPAMLSSRDRDRKNITRRNGNSMHKTPNAMNSDRGGGGKCLSAPIQNMKRRERSGAFSSQISLGSTTSNNTMYLSLSTGSELKTNDTNVLNGENINIPIQQKNCINFIPEQGKNGSSVLIAGGIPNVAKKSSTASIPDNVVISDASKTGDVITSDNTSKLDDVTDRDDVINPYTSKPDDVACSDASKQVENEGSIKQPQRSDSRRHRKVNLSSPGFFPDRTGNEMDNSTIGGGKQDQNIQCFLRTGNEIDHSTIGGGKQDQNMQCFLTSSVSGMKCDGENDHVPFTGNGRKQHNNNNNNNNKVSSLSRNESEEDDEDDVGDSSGGSSQSLVLPSISLNQNELRDHFKYHNTFTTSINNINNNNKGNSNAISNNRLDEDNQLCNGDENKKSSYLSTEDSPSRRQSMKQMITVDFDNKTNRGRAQSCDERQAPLVGSSLAPSSIKEIFRKISSPPLFFGYNSKNNEVFQNSSGGEPQLINKRQLRRSATDHNFNDTNRNNIVQKQSLSIGICESLRESGV